MPGAAPAPRPPLRPWSSLTALDQFAITTWSTPLERLAAVLPPGIEPERFELDDGEAVALVSAVSFLDRDYRFRGAPFVRLSCGQINHRAYVRRDGEPGVWFVGTSLDSRLVHVPRLLWSMPWHRERIRITATWSADGCDEMSVDAIGAWGATTLRLGGTPDRPAPGVLRSPLVTDPLVGWYPRRDGRLGRYTVWHEPLVDVLVPVGVHVARSAPFTALGVLDAEQPPLGAMVTPSIDFDVHTPPRRVRPGTPLG